MLAGVAPKRIAILNVERDSYVGVPVFSDLFKLLLLKEPIDNFSIRGVATYRWAIRFRDSILSSLSHEEHALGDSLIGWGNRPCAHFCINADVIGWKMSRVLQINSKI